MWNHPIIRDDSTFFVCKMMKQSVFKISEVFISTINFPYFYDRKATIRTYLRQYMTKQKIRFIINPHSGIRLKQEVQRMIKRHLNHSIFDYDIQYTKYPKHATELAKAAVSKNIDIVVAVGGDGSVNEVAAGLIGSDTILGILPMGSGNGFAGHLGLGRGAKKALKILNQQQFATIDTCTVNDIPFVNLVGFGFDGLIAKTMKGSKIRGVYGYAQNVLRHVLNYQSLNYTIQIDKQAAFERTAFMLNIVNGTTYGYNFHFHSKAKLNDGLIHLLIFKDVARWKYFGLLLTALRGKIHKSKSVEVFDIQQVTINSKNQTFMEMDGDSFQINSPFEVKIVPKSLKVAIPNDSIYLN